MMKSPPLYVKNQVAPCGITCGTCELGNGTAAETAKRIIELINSVGIKDWSPSVPGGSDLNWEATEKTLGWMTKYAYCAGCERGGGPPNCAIRMCANEKRARSAMNLRAASSSTGSVITPRSSKVNLSITRGKPRPR